MTRRPPCRRPCLIGAAALVLLAGLAVLAAHLVPRYATERLIAAVQTQKQRTLRLDGVVQLDFLPRPAIRLGTAQLSEAGAATPFAAIESASLAVSLLPLLRREVVIERLEVDGLRATVVRRADGSLNLDDLLQSDPASPVVLRADAAAIHLTVAHLAFRDEGSGRSLDLRDGVVEAPAPDVAAPRRVSLAGRIEAAPHAVVALRASGGLRHAPDTPDISVERPEATLAVMPPGQPPLEVRVAAAAARWRRAAGVLEIDAAVATARGRRDAGEISLQLGAPRLVLEPARASAAVLSATLALHRGEAALEASLAAPLALRYSDAVLDLATLSGRLVLAHPAMPKGSATLLLRGSAQADLRRQAASADLRLTLDESRARVQLAATRLTPPQLHLSIDVDQLDLDRYMPQQAADAAASPAAPPDLSGLSAAGIRGEFRFGRLRAAGIDARDVRLAF